LTVVWTRGKEKHGKGPEGDDGVTRLFQRLRILLRRPRLVLPALVLVLLCTGAGAAYLWSQYNLDAARRAIDRYDLNAAQRHLDLCLRVRFRSAAIHLLAAQTARRRDDYEKAEQHLAACLELDELNPAVGLERLLLTAQQGDLIDVQEVLRARTGGNDPQAVLVLEALARAYVNRCLQLDALVSLNLLLQREPDHLGALLLRARVWETLAGNGRREPEPNALADYQKALEVNPSSFEARLGQAGCLYRMGRPAEALLEYERLRRFDPAHAEVLLGLARCRHSGSEVDEARRLLDELLAHHPEHAGALLERGTLALHEGDLAGAEKWLGQAVEAAPSCDRQALRVLCRCLEAAHKDSEVRRCRERLRQRESEFVRLDCLTMQVNHEPRNLPLRFDVSVQLIRFGRELEGVAGLYLLLEQQPRYGPAHAALADYFERTGNPARAARHRRASLSADPTQRAW
jgi:tetratricopeptide (TPR) repeat protein